MIKSGILIQKRGALSEQINTSSGAIYFYCASIMCVKVKHVGAPGLCARPGWWGRESDTNRLDVLAVDEKCSRCAIGSLKQMRAFKVFWETLRSNRLQRRTFACVWVGLHLPSSHPVVSFITASKYKTSEIESGIWQNSATVESFIWCRYVCVS